MSGPKGYSTYRGRKPIGKIIGGILLVLVILGALGFILLQKYMVYDESGLPHLRLPHEDVRASVAASSAASSGELNLTIDQPTQKTLRAIQLADLPLTDWTAASQQAAAVYGDLDAVCLTVKDSSGHVYYESAAARTVSTQAIRVQSTTAAEIAAMTASDGVYAVARLSCLRDSVAARAETDQMALKNTGGYVFYDGNSENWLDPAKTQTREYLGALCVECAGLGFDELLLTDISYPTLGKLSKIAYTGSEQLSENLDLLIGDIRSALDAAGYQNVKLSVELPAVAVTVGSDKTAGLELASIAAHVSRIYAETASEEIPALIQAVQASADPAPDFVPELTRGRTTPGEGSWLFLS